MKKPLLDILQLIYHETGDKSPITMAALENETGLSGYIIRNHVEDLKQMGYIVEHKEGFFISESGRYFGSGRWIWSFEMVYSQYP